VDRKWKSELWGKKIPQAIKHEIMI
jgi:hypothetical protein